MNDTSVFSCSALLGRLCSVAGCVVCQMFPFPLVLCIFKDQFLLEQALKVAIQYIITYLCVLTRQKLEVHLQYTKSWFLYLEVASVIADKVAAVLAIAQDLFNHHNVKRKAVELVWQQLNFLKMC